MKLSVHLFLSLFFISSVVFTHAGKVAVYLAPAGEELSSAYQVTVAGHAVPVYTAKVAPADTALRWKAMDDKANSANYFETAAFAFFDMQGTVSVQVTCPEEITSAKVLPSALNLKPAIKGKSLTLTLINSGPVTVEINGKWVNALHLFASPPETNIPTAGTPDVIYFGPGIHEITHLVVTNNQTLYVAGGAIVRGIIGTNEPFSISSYSGLKNYSPTIELRGTNITLRGRGIIDGTACPTHARHLVFVQGTNINLEGVILRDSSTWTIPIRQSRDVIVDDVKLLGHRANSDGIDICNSRDVTVKNCFIRTLDDLIVVKTDRGQGEAGHIRASHCVLWNEVAHALSVGAELHENVDDVLFTDCDVIHDKGREWTLRVYHCDSARVSNIRFENLRIEESPRLISLWIGPAVWSRDSERGHIADVTFKNIQARAAALHVELKGFDATHQVELANFENVVVNGQPLALTDVTTNAFATGIRIKP